MSNSNGIGYELFRMLEGSEPYDRLLSEMSARYPTDCEEFWVDMLEGAMRLVGELQGEVMRQLSPPGQRVVATLVVVPPE